MSHFSLVCSATVILAITGCVSLPNNPSVMVLPGTGRTFEQFSNDDAICRQYSFAQIGGDVSDQSNNEIAGAVVGTALGAASGAALGGGRGAVVGAGVGLVTGGVVAASAPPNRPLYLTQQYYDIAYIQCMYAKGHQVPVSGQFSTETSHHAVSPAAAHIPPPPPGLPPPPPKSNARPAGSHSPPAGLPPSPPSK